MMVSLLYKRQMCELSTPAHCHLMAWVYLLTARLLSPPRKAALPPSRMVSAARMRSPASLSPGWGSWRSSGQKGKPPACRIRGE